MARNKESLVLLLDISPSMHNHLHYVERAMSTLVHRKFYFSKSDEVGLVLFGAEEPDNDLQKEVGGYENVVVFRPIKVVDEDILEALSRLPRGMAPGDFLDAIVVGMDLLIKKLGKGSKGNKRLCLITGAQSFIKEPDEGTREDQVWVYKKTCQEKIPSLKKYSDKAPPNDPHATREVKMDVEYKNREDPDKTVPPEQRIKGFKYGPQVVPISTAEQETLKFKPEKGVKLLGFTDASNFPRHYYMKDTNIFIAEPGNTKAILAVSAVSRAMEETKKVGILRCVWRQGQANVVLGVLAPNISDTSNVADSFYFNVIPFVEDIREFPFASFDSLPASQKPNIVQQEAADNFVHMLDLAPPEREEALRPEFTLNPVLERFYSFLDRKSRRSDADVPPVDDAVKSIIEPDPQLIVENELDTFCSQFQLKINPKKDKASKKFWRDKPSLSQEAAGNEAGDDLKNDISFDSLVARKTEQIGSLTPVQDFESMLARRDSDEWVPKALREMKKLITDLLDSSYKGNTYHKAMDCLVALRNGCVQQEEPMEYNNFMRELRSNCQGKRLNDFWELIVSKNVRLINKNEAAESDVTEEEAKGFLAKADGGRNEASEKPPEADVDEMELLLGEVV